MATYNYIPGADKSFKADVDLSAKQYYFVIPASTAGYVQACATAGACVLGILQNDPAAGEEAQVRMFGPSKIIANAGSAITYGGPVKSGSDGMGWGSATITACTHICAVACEALASGSGIEIEVFLLPPMTGRQE